MIAALGAFDGFHRGHALLFEKAREMAAPLGLEWGGVTFDSIPGHYMGAIENVLFTLHERELIRLFLGVPKLEILKFDDELLKFPPPRFWEFLRTRVAVDGIVVGRDFRFGHRREGDARLLERYCREAGVPFLAVDLLRHMEVKISSSAIRVAVGNGQCDLAAKELGYPYFMLADVNHGLGRGREIGFPTANLKVSGAKLIPLEGVYSAAVLVDGVWKAGAVSIGKSPTFGDVSDARVEVFVVDYRGDLYENNLLVFFISRLRPQARFKDANQLTSQIRADVELARAAFRRDFDSSPGKYVGFKAGYDRLISGSSCLM